MQVIFTCTLTPIPLVPLEEHKRHFFKEQFCSCSFPTLCTGKRCWEFPVEAKRPTSKSPTANTHHIRASAHRSSMQHKILSLPLTSVCQELSFTFTEAGKAELKDCTWRSPQNQGIWRTSELSRDWTLHVPQTDLFASTWL